MTETAGAAGGKGSLPACACRKSNPDILVVQPTQDRTAENASSGEGVGEVAFDHVIMADERITMSGCGRAAYGFEPDGAVS